MQQMVLFLKRPVLIVTKILVVLGGGEYVLILEFTQTGEMLRSPPLNLNKMFVNCEI